MALMNSLNPYEKYLAINQLYYLKMASNAELIAAIEKLNIVNIPSKNKKTPAVILAQIYIEAHSVKVFTNDVLLSKIASIESNLSAYDLFNVYLVLHDQQVLTEDEFAEKIGWDVYRSLSKK